MSSTTRFGELTASTLPMSSRLIRPRLWKFFSSAKHLGLESLQAGGQRDTTLPSFLRTDQPQRRVLREPLGIVDIFVAGDAATDGLAQQVRQRKLRVLPLPRVGQVLDDEIAESQTFVQLTNQNQAAVGGDPRSLEIHLQRGVEGKLKWPVLLSPIRY
jgi:hypothetical protein